MPYGQSAGQQAARTAYFSLFQSRMSYGIEVWGGSSHAKAILVLQKRAMRSLASTTTKCHAKPIFPQQGILTVYALYLKKCLLSLHNRRENLPRHEDLHGYDTRNKHNVVADFSRLSTTSDTFMTKIYNDIPSEWKKKSKTAFARIIHSTLVELCPYSLEELTGKLPKQ